MLRVRLETVAIRYASGYPPTTEINVVQNAISKVDAQNPHVGARGEQANVVQRRQVALAVDKAKPEQLADRIRRTAPPGTERVAAAAEVPATRDDVAPR